ncbi:MAG TPA: VWA domain-containing protein [Gammaproteobacteria bacterium]
MAEAEEFITDAARHATVFARDLWRRYRPPSDGPATVTLADVSPRIDLLITAVFGAGHPLRPAQPPPRVTLLDRLFRRGMFPTWHTPIPATDGATLWLPAGGLPAVQYYRTIALQQAMRARRGSAALIGGLNPLLADVYLLLEACAADKALAVLLPGMVASINTVRKHALRSRPPLSAFPPARQPLERFVRILLNTDCDRPPVPLADSPEQSLTYARQLIEQHRLHAPERLLGPQPLFKDCWTGELRPPSPTKATRLSTTNPAIDVQNATTPRSARLPRRPDVRDARDNEDDDPKEPGPWMIQADEPHMHAEDPMGLQRPTDRDEETAADEYGDLLSELPAARLIATPGQPKEVLLSDDPPDTKTRQMPQSRAGASGIRYPEWDYRAQAYCEPGATVRLLQASAGAQEWVDASLARHRAMLEAIRRRFEMLRARRISLRRQFDGEEIDLEAFIEGYTDLCAGGSMSEALYRTQRRIERELAITLLIDISGSTDGWVSANRRVIDVEREALLLVCIALEGMGEPFSVLAFSGDGPRAVNLRTVKRFDEHYGNEVALRIAGLEPERYTRAGAAIRHAAAQLMRESASHRLLLLLSDGKPHDVDEYEGRYGVEDTRQAIIEARLQGIFPFCLTIDRQAANYLPRIFGANQYALLPKPELLPTVLLDWMKRLVAV